MIDTTLRIPDALIAWGKDPALSARWARPWAHDIEELVAPAAKQSRPLTDRETDRLMNLTEALVAEAVRHGRIDLLGELDLRSAERIGLVYRLKIANPDGTSREVEIGRDGRYTWREVREVLAQDDPKGALAFMETCKALLSDSFPDARLSDLAHGLPEEVCAACGRPGTSVMLTTDTEATYHLRCWLPLIAR